jgi:hypothetical protein
MIILRLAWQSLANRWLIALLTVLAIGFAPEKRRVSHEG